MTTRNDSGCRHGLVAWSIPPLLVAKKTTKYIPKNIEAIHQNIPLPKKLDPHNTYSHWLVNSKKTYGFLFTCINTLTKQPLYSVHNSSIQCHHMNLVNDMLLTNVLFSNKY